MTQAQLLIHNAVLWSDGRLLAETAVAVVDGRIAELGGEDLRERYRADRTLDARGGLVAPGFADAHVHAIFGGVESIRCDLSDCTSADEVYTAIAEYAASHPDEPWILGGGWRMPHFAGGTPLAVDLDRIVPDRPAYLINSDHHGAWVNSRALQLAGITADTPDPADGRIERDRAGRPSGTLQEGATDLIGRVLPETTPAEGRLGLLAAQERLFELGITCWQEAILGAYAGYPDLTAVYRETLDAGELRGRATGALWVSRDFDGLTIPDFVEHLAELRDRFGGPDLDLSTAKIMVDGVPENETAAMLEPYGDGSSGEPVSGAEEAGHRDHNAACTCAPGPVRSDGLSYFSREQLTELLPLLNARGFSAHLHAIGDRAVRYALDAIEAVPRETRNRVRNHIAHIQIVHPHDLPRFAELGVTVNAQMLWAYRDEQMVELTLPLLGEQRAGWQYPFASLLRSGAPFACGSDWPVSTPDPWQAIHVAVTRQEPGSSDYEPLIPAEAITLHEALRGYTAGSQQLLGGSEGELRVGARADLSVANQNPFALDASAICTTRNAATVLGGDVVFEREPLEPSDVRGASPIPG